MIFIYRIAILEDDIVELNDIYQRLEKYCQQKNLSIQIDQFNDTTLFPFEIKYDALFLDIVMPEIDSITSAKNVLKHYEPLFTFITHNNNLMLDTFSVHAYDFIPKANLENRLIPIFEDDMRRLSKTCQKLSMKTLQRNIYCTLNDIIYIEIFDHTLSIITKHDVHHCRMALSTILSKISHPSFVLINQSTCININNILLRYLTTKNYI